MGLREKLLETKLKEQSVELEGEMAVVKEMTAGEASKYENSLYKMVGGKIVFNTEDAKPKLVALTLYDNEGSLVFGAKNIEQVKMLPSHIVDEVYQIAMKLNGLEGKKKN